MKLAEAEIDLEYPEINYELPEENCAHCGGIMRYYMGTVSCLLCGRDHTHHCQMCLNKSVVVNAASQAQVAQVKAFTELASQDNGSAKHDTSNQKHDNAAA
ncbi:MAG: hypothetical protein OEZ32_08275 [Nitrospinota bacterium]|nr:hypothetical protein [Nitrospinota bacterium]